MHNVKKLIKEKKLIFIAIIIVIILFALALIFINIRDEPKVEISTVKMLYKQLKPEEDDKDYRYKLYGYTYDEHKNIEMSVMQGYVEDGKVYDMDGKEIGNYEKKNLNRILDNASLKTYTFTYKNGKYTLKK